MQTCVRRLNRDLKNDVVRQEELFQKVSQTVYATHLTTLSTHAPTRFIVEIAKHLCPVPIRSLCKTQKERESGHWSPSPFRSCGVYSFIEAPWEKAKTPRNLDTPTGTRTTSSPLSASQ
uniref:Uncharacterized protein n=1 Tax=Panagrellus redivivus TaxID=6233 RepID=A0A7E4W4I9_PANRE